MRFMLLVYPDAHAAAEELPLDRVQAMQRYNEELQKAGALLALDGLMPPEHAARLRFDGDDRAPSVTDGPFTEAKELVGGFWIIQARSREEAVEWASRAPIGFGTIEVRQIAGEEDYGEEIADAARLPHDPPEQTVAD